MVSALATRGLRVRRPASHAGGHRHRPTPSDSDSIARLPRVGPPGRRQRDFQKFKKFKKFKKFNNFKLNLNDSESESPAARSGELLEVQDQRSSTQALTEFNTNFADSESDAGRRRRGRRGGPGLRTHRMF